MSRTEKLMAALIAMLVIGICLRWGYIRREAGEAVRNRIERIRGIRPETAANPAAESPADPASRQR